LEIFKILNNRVGVLITRGMEICKTEKAGFSKKCKC